MEGGQQPFTQEVGMHTVEPIMYVLALNDRHNCSVIESFSPGQEGDVNVVPENDLTAKPIKAKARRSQDGEDFTFTMPDGETGSWAYDFLKYSAIPFYKPAK
jgi:hypothetical protein